jgi:hypothetical protein
MHHRHSHSRYPKHNGMKTSLSDPVIGTVAKVPIQAKMNDDNEDHNGLHFGSSQESELEPPLVLESVWDCPGISLDTTVDEDGKTIPGWHCNYCLIPGNRGGPRFFKHQNASKSLSHLTKGKDIGKGEGHCHLHRHAEHSCKRCPCLNHIDVSKGK